MAQHDYDIANQSGANFRADLNNALDAIVSNNSGSSEPSTTFAYEWWIDTSANVLKLRNSANNAWITLPLSITADNSTSGALTVNGNLTTTGTVDINGQELILDADADTSITADTDDQIDIRIAGADVYTVTASSFDFNGKELILDADADSSITADTDDQIDIKIGGTDVMQLTNSSNDFVFKNPVQDKDILFKGNDGGSEITALTLDMSGSGFATFNSGATIVNDLFFNTSGGATVGYPHNDGNDFVLRNFVSTGNITFKTNAAERMRITSSGALVVGGTTADGADTVTLHQGGFVGVRQTGSSAMELRRDSSDGTILEFRKDGTLVGTISTNANSLPSDKNFKRDISDLDLGLNLVTQLKPSQYCYKVSDENSPKMYGLIAQDLEESLTEVGIEKNSAWLLQHNPKEDVNESDYSLDYTKLIPILINSIQELEARVKTLEG